ncbi:hypothetical protein Pmani_028808 [Petrolisthes manimaculis]|uniref:Uncharacterized protein n=1 Tax=Petrolisthes manimaculis TaxID=1843537 RepID=A0AAE1P002_9EUCA|nr:hypothetical protein Pmani_028808 [Petrolisthes manimaculis]
MNRGMWKEGTKSVEGTEECGGTEGCVGSDRRVCVCRKKWTWKEGDRDRGRGPPHPALVCPVWNNDLVRHCGCSSFTWVMTL